MDYILSSHIFACPKEANEHKQNTYLRAKYKFTMNSSGLYPKANVELYHEGLNKQVQFYTVTSTRYYSFLLEPGVQNIQWQAWISNQLIIWLWRTSLIRLCLTLCIHKMEIINIHFPHGIFAGIIINYKNICGCKLYINILRGQSQIACPAMYW